MLLVAVGKATSSKGREAGVSEGDRLPGRLKPETVELEVDGPRALVTKLERGRGSPHGRLLIPLPHGAPTLRVPVLRIKKVAWRRQDIRPHTVVSVQTRGLVLLL